MADPVKVRAVFKFKGTNNDEVTDIKNIPYCGAGQLFSSASVSFVCSCCSLFFHLKNLFWKNLSFSRLFLVLHPP
jgi:hypothetical protein